jgi:hypothetical protein
MGTESIYQAYLSGLFDKKLKPVSGNEKVVVAKILNDSEEAVDIEWAEVPYQSARFEDFINRGFKWAPSKSVFK